MTSGGCRRGKEYTPADDAEMMRLYHAGLSYSKIAETLGRERGSVSARMSRNMVAGRIARIRKPKPIKWGNRTNSPVKGAAIIPAREYPLGTFLDDYPELAQFSDIPEADEAWFKKAKLVMPKHGESE